jgi:hypothetical protein
MAEDEQRTGQERDELEEQHAELLPDREAMTVITPPIELAPGTFPIVEPPGHTLPVEPNDPT